jgi:hypothetical protein
MRGALLCPQMTDEKKITGSQATIRPLPRVLTSEGITATKGKHIMTRTLTPGQVREVRAWLTDIGAAYEMTYLTDEQAVIWAGLLIACHGGGRYTIG